jgi:tetratricopeptide (TPR) repeat protein
MGKGVIGFIFGHIYGIIVVSVITIAIILIYFWRRKKVSLERGISATNPGDQEEENEMVKNQDRHKTARLQEDDTTSARDDQSIARNVLALSHKHIDIINCMIKRKNKEARNFKGQMKLLRKELEIKRNLNIYDKREHTKKGIDLLEEHNLLDALEEFNEAIKEKPSDTIARISLGIIYLNINEYKKAAKCFDKALIMAKDVYGYDHPFTAKRYNSIGKAWEKHVYKHKKAVKNYNMALNINKTAYGNEHPSVADTYSNIGEAWEARGDHKKAIKFYSKALKINKAIYEDEHPSVAVIYNKLGEIWKNSGRYDKAIKNFDRALRINLVAYGDGYPSVADTYSSIGETRRCLSEYDKALENFDKALKINKAISGDGHPSVVIIYNNIGDVWNRLGEYNKALYYYDKALKTVLNIYGKRKSDVAATYSNSKAEYSNSKAEWKNLGDYKHRYNSAIKFAEKTYEIFKRLLGEKNPNTQKTKKNLELIRKIDSE